MKRKTPQSGEPPEPPDLESIEEATEERVKAMLHALRRRVVSTEIRLRDVDERLGVSQGYSSHLLQGNLKLQISHIAALAQVLGIDPRSLYAEVFPEVQEVGEAEETAEDNGETETAERNWLEDRSLLVEIVREILEDLLPEFRQESEADGARDEQSVDLLSKESKTTNLAVRQMLRRATAEQGLRAAEVARRLGKRPDWLYKSFTTPATTLRFSFCLKVLLACDIEPGVFFERALRELEGNAASEAPSSPSREEIRRHVEPIVAELLGREEDSEENSPTES